MTHAELMATPQMKTAIALKNAALDGMDQQSKRIVDLEEENARLSMALKSIVEFMPHVIGDGDDVTIRELLAQGSVALAGSRKCKREWRLAMLGKD